MAEIKSKNTLKESTAKGFFWAAFSNGTQQVVTMLIGIVLARILSVSDYALVAMLSVFSLIAGNLQESGFISALCVKKEAKHEDFNAVFWFSIITSLCIYALLFFCAPLIAKFNNTEELTLLGRIIFIGFFISSFGTAHAAYLFRNLMVKEKTSSQVMASLTSGTCGLIAAFAECGYWSLVIMDLTYKITYTSLIWHLSPWRPTCNINLKPAFRMFGFSSRLLITNLLTTLNNQVLQSILGHFYVRNEVGQFSQANKWTTMSSSLVTGMVGNVAQPVLASVNDEANRQIRIFRKMLSFTAMITLPAILGLGLIAPEFIYLTIGEKWLPCVPYLQILCIAGAFIPLNQMFSNLLISKGQSNYFLLSTCGFLLCQLTAVLTLYPYGILQLLYAIASLNVGWLVVWFLFARHLVQITFLQVLHDILPFILISFVSLACGFLATMSLTNPWLILFTKIVVTAVVYTTIMQLLGMEIWKECLTFALNNLRKLR